ncbi:putative conserved protein YbjT [Cyclonatronum proteinivorum]|uniref:Putative conserved protein YbjT n=1 Tax=Cyclonatronum proteinivorum TaxID=1457365 RepID=A0A345UKS8_9BACT|nr:NAD-dependent epimerase/dehydratase family protein [Cyclonatronum proteinivorum]AXJ01080.1 putative conserved protein YbjT [Cyclonatronum proteinivorum]
MAKKALLIGATGLIGSHLLSYLLDAEQYDTVAVVGRRSTGVKHPKLVEHICDFASMNRHPEIFACDDFYNCMGTTIKKAGSKDAFREVDYTYPLAAANLALAGGAKSCWLVSSIGADITSSIFYLKTKGEVEKAFAEAGFDRTIIFRPAGLLGKRNEFRLKETVGIGFMKLISPLLVGGLKKNRPIEAQHVAYVMAHQPVNHVKGSRVFESHEIQQIYDSMMMGCRYME